MISGENRIWNKALKQGRQGHMDNMLSWNVIAIIKTPMQTNIDAG